jgi:hypothetical protein
MYDHLEDFETVEKYANTLDVTNEESIKIYGIRDKYKEKDREFFHLLDKIILIGDSNRPLRKFVKEEADKTLKTLNNPFTSTMYLSGMCFGMAIGWGIAVILCVSFMLK